MDTTDIKAAFDALPIDDKLDRVRAWQEAGHVHPLTCGNDSTHALLVPEVWDFGTPSAHVLLVCLTCGYQQKHIPPLPSRLELEVRGRELERLRLRQRQS